jgi:nucleosome binding factor SPN SPT16 subunit
MSYCPNRRQKQKQKQKQEQKQKQKQKQTRNRQKRNQLARYSLVEKGGNATIATNGQRTTTLGSIASTAPIAGRLV